MSNAYLGNLLKEYSVEYIFFVVDNNNNWKHKHEQTKNKTTTTAAATTTKIGKWFPKWTSDWNSSFHATVYSNGACLIQQRSIQPVKCSRVTATFVTLFAD